MLIYILLCIYIHISKCKYTPGKGEKTWTSARKSPPLGTPVRITITEVITETGMKIPYPSSKLPD